MTLGGVRVIFSGVPADCGPTHPRDPRTRSSDPRASRCVERSPPRRARPPAPRTVHHEPQVPPHARTRWGSSAEDDAPLSAEQIAEWESWFENGFGALRRRDDQSPRLRSMPVIRAGALPDGHHTLPRVRAAHAETGTSCRNPRSGSWLEFDSGSWWASFPAALGHSWRSNTRTGERCPLEPVSARSTRHVGAAYGPNQRALEANTVRPERAAARADGGTFAPMCTVAALSVFRGALLAILSL
jgi:hypothetical protein